MAANIAKLIEVRSSVVAPASHTLSMSAVCMSNFYLFPQNKLLSFKNAKDVAELFGASSNEAKAAEIYFKGYDNSITKPKVLRFWKYSAVPQPAYLFSGSLPETTADIASITNGAIRFVINGTHIDVSNLDFSTVQSWFDVAHILNIGLSNASADIGSLTYNKMLHSLEFITKTAGTQAAVGYCTDIPDASAGLRNPKKPAGRPNDGTALDRESDPPDGYGSTLENNPRTAGTSIVNILALGEGTAHLFQGTEAQSPEENISALTAQENNFTTIIFSFDIPDNTAVDIAQYIHTLNTQEPQFVFLPYTSNVNNFTPNSQETLSFKLQGLEGSSVVFGNYTDAALFAGIAACMDLDAGQTITLAFKTQTGKTAVDITDKQFDALISNKINFYAQYSAKANDYNITYPAAVNGQYNYLDSFYNAIWLSETVKNDFAQYLLTVGRIPYTPQGYSLIAAKMMQIANKGIANRIINANVALSDQQLDILKQLITQKDINSLYNNGFFFWVKDPAHLSDRIDRLSPDILFIYTYGGAVQKLVFNVYQYQ